MRLLEPLNGIKMAQGHVLVHLIFFISMMLINTDINIQLHPESKREHHAGEAHFYERSVYDQDQQMLSGGGNHAGHAHAMTTQEKKEHELLVFNILKYGHLFTFLAQITFFYIKSQGKYNLSQFIQCCVVPAGYFFPLVYAIYVAKVDFETWVHDVNYVRVWLLCEITFFWMWLGSGIIFLLYAYIAKFKSIFKNEVLLQKDDNVWNDKDSDDFLRYLKQEYYMFAYMLSFMAMEIRTGFVDNDSVTRLNKSKSLETAGLSNPVNQCYALAFIARSFCLMYYIVFMGRSANSMVDYDKDQLVKQNTSMTKFQKFVFPVFQMMFPITIFIIWSQNNYLSDHNPLASIWIQTELIAVMVNIPGQHLAMYLVRRQQDKIKVASVTEAKGLLGKISFLDDGETQKIADYSLNTGIQGKESSVVPVYTDDVYNAQDILGAVGDDIKARWEKIVKAKKTLEFEEDFFAFTVLCFTKKNTDAYLITPQKQSQNFYAALVVAGVVISMLGCMHYAIYTNENGDYTPSVSHSFAVFYIKFPCAIALHFYLYPEVAKGMNLMKFANNQSVLFVPNGSEISFVIGLVQVITALTAEIINLHMLSLQHTVSHSIMHFVALEIIMEVSNLYFESLMSNKLKVIMHHPPELVVKGADIKFMQRSLFHKVARMIYKTIRCLYVSCIFYFVPFAVLYLQWIMVPDHSGHGH